MPWVLTRWHASILLFLGRGRRLQAGLLLSGAVLTETVFAWNGIGRYLFQAITQRDYPVLQGFILFIALAYALVNLLVDVLYGLIDPRVRVS